MRNATNWLLLGAVLALVGAMAIQHQSTRRLQSEVAALRQQLVVPEPAAPEIKASTGRVSPSPDATVLHFLELVREQVAFQDIEVEVVVMGGCCG